MKKLIISGDDNYIKSLKAHLEKEHPKTKGRMTIEQKIIKKQILKENIKKSLNDLGSATKRAFSPIDDVMKKIDDDIRKNIKI